MNQSEWDEQYQMLDARRLRLLQQKAKLNEKLERVELQLATDFLSTVEEEPTFELDTQDKVDQWMAFKKQSYKFYTLIAKAGNRFWLTHKADKRGRLYASGYNISTMGSAFKKSCIELAKEELVTGVPS